MKEYIVKPNDGHVIYGMTPNELYKVIGRDSKGCYVIENNSGELISVHRERAVLVFIRLNEEKELKKRDTPMKPKMVDYNTTQHFLCPSCNKTFSIDGSKTYNKIFNAFCRYCGQRLDWEELK